MQLDRAACDRARKSRDARFDGKFFIAVITTKIYCRPICPARSPHDQHVAYYATAAAAEAAGYRPCLRCRPEASPGTPAWWGTSSVVSRGLRLIADGALDRAAVGPLADRLGVTPRHLRRLFVQHLGATPLEVALTRRVQSAKKLIDDTRLPFSDVALAAGFGSLRRFNAEIRRTYARTPTQLRGLGRAREADAGCYSFRLAYRPPYDWPALIAFLRARATPGVEHVADDAYERTVALGNSTGSIRVAPAGDGRTLNLEVRFTESRHLLGIVERVRRMFDVGADPAAIAELLAADPLLKATLAAHPGVRTPGAWDGFEIAVRAVLGQQITVKAATTLAGRVAERWGAPVAMAPGLTRLFPSAAPLAGAPLEDVGIIRTRANAIRGLARAVCDGRLRFDGDGTQAALRAIPGIGDWTAQYVMMRAANEPDAFPSGDLILQRMAGGLSAGALEARSHAWRPWRAYAVMLLWQAATDAPTPDRRKKRAHKETPGLRRSTRPVRRLAAADPR
jgi:AraC family transcriptional regulator of adaptative response / DNA-3-methyladenine glycosylase II